MRGVAPNPPGSIDEMAAFCKECLSRSSSALSLYIIKPHHFTISILYRMRPDISINRRIRACSAHPPAKENNASFGCPDGTYRRAAAASRFPLSCFARGGRCGGKHGLSGKRKAPKAREGSCGREIGGNRCRLADIGRPRREWLPACWSALCPLVQRECAGGVEGVPRSTSSFYSHTRLNFDIPSRFTLSVRNKPT